MTYWARVNFFDNSWNTVDQLRPTGLSYEIQREEYGATVVDITGIVAEWPEDVESILEGRIGDDNFSVDRCYPE